VVSCIPFVKPKLMKEVLTILYVPYSLGSRPLYVPSSLAEAGRRLSGHAASFSPSPSPSPFPPLSLSLSKPKL